jgi:hypothetical protein
VIAGAGIVLFFAPTLANDIWGWELTPFNTRFLGAIYLAAIVDFAVLAVVRRWVPARLVMPMDLVFTSIILVVSLSYLDQFKWERPVTWAWFVIFVTVPLYSAYFLWRFRRLSIMAPAAPSSHSWSKRARLGLRGSALALAVYGVGMLAAPATFAGFWPWPVDGFHGRVYSAIFVSLAVAGAIVSGAPASLELATLGLTCVALGALEPIGLLVVDSHASSVDWSSAGTLAWIAMFAAILVYGLALAAASLRRESLVPSAVRT